MEAMPRGPPAGPFLPNDLGTILALEAHPDGPESEVPVATASPTALLAVQDRPIGERSETKGPEHSDGQFASLMAQFTPAPRAARAPESVRPRPVQSNKGSQAERSSAPSSAASETAAAPAEPASKAEVPAARTDSPEPQMDRPNPGPDAKPVKGAAPKPKALPAGSAAPSTPNQVSDDATASAGGAVPALPPVDGTLLKAEPDGPTPAPLGTTPVPAVQAPEPSEPSPEIPAAASQMTKALAPAPPGMGALRESLPTPAQTPKAATPWTEPRLQPLPTPTAPPTEPLPESLPTSGPALKAAAPMTPQSDPLAKPNGGQDSPANLTQSKADLSSDSATITLSERAAPSSPPANLDPSAPLQVPSILLQAGRQATSPVDPSPADAALIKPQTSVSAVMADLAARLRSGPDLEGSTAMPDRAGSGTPPGAKATRGPDLPFFTQEPVETKPQALAASSSSGADSSGLAETGKPGILSAPTPEAPQLAPDSSAVKPALSPQTAAAHAVDGSALAMAGVLPRAGETAPTPLPAAAPAPASPPTAPVVQVDGGLRWMLKGGVQEAQLQLHPDSLGQVTIHLKVLGSEVHARLWITEPASVQTVQEGRPHLEQSLREHGLQLASFDLQQGHRPFQEPPSTPAFREPSTLNSSPARQEAPAASPISILSPHHVELYA